jgi:arginyl-tRNA synthetase
MRQKIRKVIDDTLAALRSRELCSSETPTYSVASPRHQDHGDWSCNVAMLLSRSEGKKPQAIARLIVDNLVDADGVVAKADVAGPGFVNIWVTPWSVQQVVREILAAGDAFGRQPAGSTGKRINVEFVSANPTGPIHVGHARGAFVGDGIARVLEAAGHQVTREFYINDFGNQVTTLGRTVYKRYKELRGESVVLAEGEYPAAYVIDIARTWNAEVGDRYVDAPESEWLPAAVAIAIQENLKGIRSTLAKAGIRHDIFFSEASLHSSGKVREIVERYRQRGVTYEAAQGLRREEGEKVRSEDSKAAQYGERQKGGTFLRTATYEGAGKSAVRDDEDRVILRADGTPVYLTADLAYHCDKIQRGYDTIVDVWGADHSGHVPRIGAGVVLLGEDPAKLKFVLVQMVRITRGGQEVTISKRRGTVFELSDLIEEAGPDVCRFLFLVKTRDAQFDFDLELIKQQSRENPVFYFQYGHARCASILLKAESRGVPFQPEALTDAALQRLVLPEELAILKKASQLPDMVAVAAENLEPHLVLYFCQELIGDFHSYYTRYKADPVISDDLEKSQGRLALVAAVKRTLQNAFNILGIEAPDRMDAPEADS